MANRVHLTEKVLREALPVHHGTRPARIPLPRRTSPARALGVNAITTERSTNPLVKENRAAT